MKEALYYTAEGKYLHCTLCPHNCRLSEGQKGVCGVRQNIGGKLFALSYNRVTAYNYDPIEKKPLFHFKPGQMIFSFGSYGCNLGCDFCQNWELISTHDNFVEVSSEDIVSLAGSKGSIGIAYTYNEPVVSFESVLETAKLAKERGLANVLVTNGYINQEPLEELLPYIDAMNIDLKSMTDEFYQSICKGTLTPVLKTIATAAAKTHIEVTTLVIEGRNSSFGEMEELTEFLSGISKDIPLHLSRYHPSHRMTDPPTSPGTLNSLREIAKKRMNYVYIGNVYGVNNDTRCPYCESLLIDRSPYGKVVGIVDGHCKECGEKVPFVQ
ncbi:MAG: AmmeMemoRadiSam system radical SAM enzyme [Gudongella sp.]|jgi:pyruvate formate lyase activating enzyme|nr:AmmeMemoRadiSam system radical SAM enzyme [Gudongella sp.]